MSKNYGRWTPTGQVIRKYNRAYVEVKCECGTVAFRDLVKLQIGATTSCGCAPQKRYLAAKDGVKPVITHGDYLKLSDFIPLTAIEGAYYVRGENTEWATLWARGGSTDKNPWSKSVQRPAPDALAFTSKTEAATWIDERNTWRKQQGLKRAKYKIYHHTETACKTV